MTIQKNMQIEERRLYERYLKDLRNIDILATDEENKRQAKDDLSNLALKISSSAFPVFEEIGEKVHVHDCGFFSKLLNLNMSYSEIGKTTLENDPRLFLTHLQSILARKLITLPDEGFLGLTKEEKMQKFTFDAANFGITMEDVETEIKFLQLKIALLKDPAEKEQAQLDLRAAKMLKVGLSGIKDCEKKD